MFQLDSVAQILQMNGLKITGELTLQKKINGILNLHFITIYGKMKLNLLMKIHGQVFVHIGIFGLMNLNIINT